MFRWGLFGFECDIWPLSQPLRYNKQASDEKAIASRREPLLIGGGIEHTLCTLLWCEDSWGASPLTLVRNLLYPLSFSYYLFFFLHTLTLLYFLFSISFGRLTFLPYLHDLIYLHSLNASVLAWTGPPKLHITTWIVYIIKTLPSSVLYSLCISGPFWEVCACVSVGEGISHIQGPLVVLMHLRQCRTTLSAMLKPL